MPREHSRIKMSQEEVGAFASSEERCVVASLDDGGGPWGDAAACVFRGGRLYFRVPRDGRTALNIARDPRVCCVLESHPTGAEYYTIKGAMLHGRAEPADDVAEARSALDGVRDPVTGGSSVGEATFSVGTDDVASFDFAKIQRRFER